MCDFSSRSVLMSFFSAILITIGWVLNILVLPACRLVIVNDANDIGKNIGMGLYLFQSVDGDLYDYCYSIDWNEWTSNLPYWTDGRMNAARACGGVAALIGFILMVVMWCAMCCACVKSKCVRMTFGFFAILCCALAGCIFLVNGSSMCSNGCTLSSGSGLVIGAVIAYFLSALLVCCAPDDPDDADEDRFVPPPQSKGPATNTVSVERTEQVDGTVSVKTTTTHPDGSKTVQETIEHEAPAGGADIEATPY